MSSIYFEKMIFLGNGESSMAQCYELHRKVEEALNILGGLQQPRMSTDPAPTDADVRQDRRMKWELHRLIEQISVALGKEQIEDPRK